MSSTNWNERERMRLNAENRMLRTEIFRLREQIARLELQKMVDDNRDRTDVAWLTGKVLRQKRRIKALEESRALARLLSVEDAEKREADKGD